MHSVLLFLKCLQIWCHEMGISPHSYEHFVSEDGTIQLENGRLFLLWLGECGASGKVLQDKHGKNRSVSFETFDQAPKWLKMKVDNQLERKCKSILPKGYVMTLPGLKSMKQKLTSVQRMDRFNNCTEADQRSDLMLTFEQMKKMAESVLAADTVSASDCTSVFLWSFFSFFV